jgi:dTDP-4-amino-4,6-dideoxygalactose transaminase
MRGPFNRPLSILPAMPYLQVASHHSGDGPFTKRASKLLSEKLDGAEVLLTTSCTHALEMAALLLDIKPGDEVIVPSFTFVSTVNAFVLRGATPIFADCRPDTLNMDEAQLADLITPRTKAIVPVHYAGVGCEMDVIMGLAATHGIAVVEDNAHGLFGAYKGKKLGTFGALATQSFHETKNISCGEGGALVINDSGYHQRAEIIREKGTNRSRFFRGEVDKYSWVDLGSSYLPSDILAAVLLAQLEDADVIQSKRKAIWHRYDQELAVWRNAQGVRGPIIPDHCEQAYHMYYMLMPDLETRSRFLAYVKERGVLAVFHYLPLNTSEMGLKLGGYAGQCPVTEDISDRLVRLPMFADLTNDELAYVIDVVTSFEG